MACKEGAAVAPDAVFRVRFSDRTGIPVWKLAAGQWDRGRKSLMLRGEREEYCVFQRSCAFLTFWRAVSAVKGGIRDIVLVA